MVAQDVTLLKFEAVNSLCSCDEESVSTQLVVSHLAVETPANQHAGAGASDSVSLSRLPLLDHDVDLYPGERNTHAQYNLRTFTT